MTEKIQILIFFVNFSNIDWKRGKKFDVSEQFAFRRGAGWRRRWRRCRSCSCSSSPSSRSSASSAWASPHSFSNLLGPFDRPNPWSPLQVCFSIRRSGSAPRARSFATLARCASATCASRGVGRRVADEVEWLRHRDGTRRTRGADGRRGSCARRWRPGTRRSAGSRAGFVHPWTLIPTHSPCSAFSLRFSQIMVPLSFLFLCSWNASSVDYGAHRFWRKPNMECTMTAWLHDHVILRGQSFFSCEVTVASFVPCWCGCGILASFGYDGESCSVAHDGVCSVVATPIACTLCPTNSWSLFIKHNVIWLAY
jgi:hypothetical protein